MNENISYRKLAVELGLIDPHSVRDWLDLYENKGEAGIQTTHARGPYLKHPERLDKIADKSLKDRLEYLEAENAYLKKLYSLIQKRRKPTKKIKAICQLSEQYSLHTFLNLAGMAKSTLFYGLQHQDD